MFSNTEEHMTAYFSMFVLCAVFNGFNVRSENANIFEHIEKYEFLKVMGNNNSSSSVINNYWW